MVVENQEDFRKTVRFPSEKDVDLLQEAAKIEMRSLNSFITYHSVKAAKQILKIDEVDDNDNPATA